MSMMTSVPLEEAILPPPEFDTARFSDESSVATHQNVQGVEFEEFDIESDLGRIHSPPKQSSNHGIITHPNLKTLTDVKPQRAEYPKCEKPSSNNRLMVLKSPQPALTDHQGYPKANQSSSALSETAQSRAEPKECNGEVNSTLDTVESRAHIPRNRSVFMNKTERLIADEIRDYRLREDELRKLRASAQTEESDDPQHAKSLNQKGYVTPNHQLENSANTSVAADAMGKTISSNKPAIEEYSHVERMTRKLAAVMKSNAEKISPNYSRTNGLIYEATLPRPSKHVIHQKRLKTDSGQAPKISDGIGVAMRDCDKSETGSSFSSSLQSVRDDDQLSERSVTSDSGSSSKSSGPATGSSSSHRIGDRAVQIQSAIAAAKQSDGAELDTTRLVSTGTNACDHPGGVWRPQNRAESRGLMERFVASGGKERSLLRHMTKGNQLVNSSANSTTSESDTERKTSSLIKETRRKFNCGELNEQKTDRKQSVEEKIRDELISMQQREEELRYQRWRNLAVSHSDLTASSEQHSSKLSTSSVFSLKRTSSNPNLLNID